MGDYAIGKDSGTIELVLVGNVNEAYLQRLAEKAKGLLHRNIKTEVMCRVEFNLNRVKFEKALLVWGI